MTSSALHPHPLSGQPVVALDVESDGQQVLQLGLAGPKGSRLLTDASAMRRALSEILASRPLLVGHNLLAWDLPLLRTAFPDLPWDGVATVDTLLWQARLTPWRANLALATTHQAQADAEAALALFMSQLGQMLDERRQGGHSAHGSAEAVAAYATHPAQFELSAEVGPLRLHEFPLGGPGERPSPDNLLEPEGLHPWLGRVIDTLSEMERGDAKYSNPPRRLVVLPPFLLAGLAARKQAVVLGASGDVCLREHASAWRAWTQGHSVAALALHSMARPPKAQRKACSTCPESGCPAHPDRQRLFLCAWSELESPAVQQALRQWPPEHVVLVGGDLAARWMERQEGQFSEADLALAGVPVAALLVAPGAGARLRVRTHTAGQLCGQPDARERQWWLERTADATAWMLGSAPRQPEALVAGLGTRAPRLLHGLLPLRHPERPMLRGLADEQEDLGGPTPVLSLSCDSPLRAPYWCGLLPRLALALDEVPTLLAVRREAEIPVLIQALQTWKPGLEVVQAPDLGTLLRRLHRTPHGIGLLPAARLDELPGLHPTGLRLVLEAMDLQMRDATSPASSESGPRADAVEDLGAITAEHEAAPESDEASTDLIPTGWRLRACERWLRETGRVLADWTDAGGGEVWCLDARLTKAPAKVGVTLQLKPARATPLTEEQAKALRPLFPTPPMPKAAGDWCQLLERAFLSGRGENGGPGHFRDDQIHYLTRVMEGVHDQIVSLPTGGGKSVIFQGPALLKGSWTHRLSVVIAPLKALMTDQVASLMRQGFVGVVEAITGDLDPFELADIHQRLAGGEVWMVYVSPERFRSRSFLRALNARLERDGRAEYWIFDEAHCISQWGLDFRPDYHAAARKVQATRLDSREPAPILLLSATLSRQAEGELDAHFSRGKP